MSCERIHGNRSQAQRTLALAGFKSGKHRVLVDRLADAALLANADGLGLGPNGGKCDNTLAFGSAGGCVVVPFGDMDANYSNGSSIYHGFTANLRKRFNQHFEFLASYTWSHAIDNLSSTFSDGSNLFNLGLLELESKANSRMR